MEKRDDVRESVTGGSIARDAPTSGASDEEKAELHDRCRSDRDEMTPHETADCAGQLISEAYENEEDGGS